MVRFLSGVRDAQGQRGYVQVAPGEVVAIDLEKGAMLWRREGVGKPVAATADRLVTLDRAGGRVVVRLFNAASGADAGRIDNLGMPDWAGRTEFAPDAARVEASEVPGGVRLQWNLRQLYRGGAPPPPHITSQAQEEVTGAAIIDLNTSQVTPAPAAPATAMATTASARETSSDPDVLSLDHVGDAVFALKAEGGGVALEARDTRGTVLWELPLSAQRAGRPTPQRM